MLGAKRKPIADRTLLVFAALLLLASCIRAEQLPIKTYTPADGLVSNRISRVVRDSRGFLWFCTEDGLSRFDGYSFTNYTTQQGLPSNWIDDFLETSDGLFLVATSVGLCVFDPEGEPLPQDRLAREPNRRPMFVTPRLSTGEPIAGIKILYEDSLGNLWCGTVRGLYRLELSNHQVMVHEVDLGLRDTHPVFSRIRGLVEDRGGRLWVLTIGELLRCSPDGRIERVAFQSPALHKEFSAVPLMGLAKDPQGNLWVATRKGLWSLTPAAPESQHPPTLVGHRYAAEVGLACEEMNAIFQDYSGRLWAGTDYGLYEFLKPERRFRLRLGVKDLKDARVWSLNEDILGNLWAGTAKGAVRLARNGFTTFTEADGIGFREVYRITEPASGAINLYTRFGESNFFLDQFDGERFVSRKVVPRAFPVQTFDWYHGQIPLRDHLGEWWWPTGKGLFRYRKADRLDEIIEASPIAHYTQKDGLPAEALRSIYEDRRGDLWISAVSGATQVIRWERASGNFRGYTVADGLPAGDNPIAFCDDHSGNLWVGFTRGSIARFRQGRFTTFGAAEGVPQGAVKQLYPDREGRIWVASSDGGLGKIEEVAAERPEITVYTTAEGLAGDSILNLAEDRANCFYVATNRGLNYVDFNTGHIKRFTTNDGLANDQVEIIFRDSLGAFWFGSVTGVSRLLSQAGPPQSAPSIFINALKIAGQGERISEVGETDLRGRVLAPGQNNIEIGFGSLSFGVGDLIRYQYRLEGADPDWQPLTTQRTVNYANLAPGRYRFLVRAVNADGVMSAEPAAFSFILQAPLWQRWWFVTLLALAPGGLIYALYRYRLAQRLAIEQMRTTIAADLHDDIGANLTKITILSEVAHHQLGTDSKSAGNTLSSIATISRESSASMRDIVWAINPRRDRLLDLTRRMRGFASDIFTSRNIEFRFTAPDRDQELRLSPKARRDIFLIFKEAVNNAARHSGCAEAVIEVSIENGFLALTVRDDGKGFDTLESSDGQGLSGMQQRAESFGGVLEIASQSGQGTSVRLQVPINRGFAYPFTRKNGSFGPSGKGVE